MNDTTIVAQTLTNAVLWLASLGYFLIPLHAPNGAGGCTCGRAVCKSAAKHPRTANGSKDATREPALLARFFNDVFPGSNVGLATGSATGVIVLDVDPRHSGDRSLMELELKYDDLPITVTSATGGGGFHFLFQHPGSLVKNSASALGPGLDIRGEGGFIVAPPSLHISGNHYRWLPGRSPAEVALAPVPRWLLDQAAPTPGRAAAERRSHLREIVTHGAMEGARNDSIARIAGYLLRCRVDPFIVLDIALMCNAAHNVPPLDESEVTSAVNSIAGAERRRRGGRDAR